MSMIEEFCGPGNKRTAGSFIQADGKKHIKSNGFVDTSKLFFEHGFLIEERSSRYISSASIGEVVDNEDAFDLPPCIVLVSQLTTSDQDEDEDDIVCLSEDEDNLAEDNKPSGTALSGWICPSLVAWTSDTPVYDAPKKFGETCLLEDVGGVGYLGPVQPKELF